MPNCKQEWSNKANTVNIPLITDHNAWVSQIYQYLFMMNRKQDISSCLIENTSFNRAIHFSWYNDIPLSLLQQ